MNLHFFSIDSSTTEIYTNRHTLLLHDALPIMLAIVRFTSPPALDFPAQIFPRPRNRQPVMSRRSLRACVGNVRVLDEGEDVGGECRSEEHTSELQSLMRISYAVFCLKKKNKQYHH